MSPLVFFKGAWNALLKNKKRSFLTMIGIVIGIAAVSTIMSIGRGFENYVVESLNPDEGELLTVDIQFQADDVDWMLETNEDFFSDMDFRMIENITGVQSVEIISMNSDFASFDTVIEGKENYIEASLTEDKGKSVIAGRSLDFIDNEKENRVVVAPFSLVESQYETEEAAIGKGLFLGDQLYTIVGIYEEDVDSSGIFADFLPQEIEIPKNSYNRYHEEDLIEDQISITVARGSLPSDVAEASISLLEEEGSMNYRGTYTHFDMSALDDGLSQVLRGITLFIASVAGISLFIAGIGVMNMMYISVSERTKEIGIRRALGASQKSIRAQFVLEGVMMTSIGGILGYLLGWLFSSIASFFLPFSTGLDLLTILVSIGVSALVGLIFSYAPANAASKKEIIDII
ncbi:ABC transporter permease [Carnobacterium sp. 17-4]|uniref:ABC transporter permease n=1 Tax=Carnobacterium sp. (strain 17-4) TaxID=208596 RepID=UPI000304FFAF|nr:FtsX-like permease family protein [Carnobacterium sp. 17-4]